MKYLYVLLSVLVLTGCVTVIDYENGKRKVRHYYPLSAKKDVHFWKGVTPLHIAASECDVEKVEKLLAKGYDPFAEVINPEDHKAYFPIEVVPEKWDSLYDNEKKKEVVRLLFIKMFKSDAKRLKRNKEERRKVFKKAIEFIPMYAVELSIRYNFEEEFEQGWKKLIALPRYSKKNGSVNMAYDAAKIGAGNILNALRKSKQIVVDMAFERQVRNIEENILLSTQDDFETLKFYKPFVSPKMFRRYYELQEYKRKKVLERRKMENSISSNNYSHGGNSIRITNCQPSSGDTACDILVDGNYKGRIFYTEGLSNHSYQISTVGSPYTAHGYYDTSLQRLRTQECGEVSVGSIHNALEKFMECAVKGHY